MTFTQTYGVSGTPEDFFGWFLEPKREEDLYKDGLGYPEYQTLERKETERGLERRTQFKRAGSMPGPVRNVLGSNFSETENGEFDKAKRRFSWTITPSALADSIHHEGSLTAEATGTGTRLTVDVTFDAKVFSVGELLKSSTEANLRKEWDRLVAVYTSQNPA